MDRCPHCGASVTGGEKCWNCGHQFTGAIDESGSDTDTSGGQAPNQEPQHGTRTADGNARTAEGAQRQARESRVQAADTQADATDERQSAGPAGADSTTEQPRRPTNQPTQDRMVGRRTVLAGAGICAAAIGAGGAGWLLLGGSSDGQALAGSVVDAIAASDWEAIEALHHDESPVIEQIQSEDEYDSYLDWVEQQRIYDTWDNTTPSLESVQTEFHIPDLTEEAAENATPRISVADAELIDETKSLAAFVTIDAVNYHVSASENTEEQREDAEEHAQHLDGGEVTQPIYIQSIAVDGDWFVWDMFRFYSPRF